MNSEVSGHTGRYTRVLSATRILRHLPHLPEKSLHRLWIAIGLVLACAAVFNYNKAHQIQTELTKKRLLEVSLQDLIVQSTALRHLNEQSSTYESKLGLEARGYGSPQELLNQLAARLAVIESTAPDTLNTNTSALRDRLLSMDQQLAEQGRPQARLVEAWYIELGLMNTAIKESLQLADEKVNSVQRNYLLLTLVVVFHALGILAVTWWKQSALRADLQRERQLEAQETQTDPLTGLLNTEGWLAYTHAFLRNMQQDETTQGSVAILDVDHFKQYNDTFGSHAGEDRLREFAEVLRSNFRPGDLIARLGDEEFAVLLPHCTARDAKRIVDRIRHRGEYKVSFSAGICDIALAETIERTMAIADHALYKAKHLGRNQSYQGDVAA